ncbi:MAG: transposase [Anaerolineaceae bacterium]
MPQREVPFLPDHYYHFYNRGNNHQAIFFERESYLFFLHGMKKYLSEYLDILGYCLMPTHYHILVRVRSFIQTSEVYKTSEVSLAMQKLLISYTKAINKRFDRVGALFQGQFQAKLIQQDDHLLHLCAYIHANPVKDNLVSRPEDWEFSNYLEWMNLRQGTLFNRQFVEEFFGTRDEYQRQVMDYIETRNIPDGVRKYLRDFED